MRRIGKATEPGVRRPRLRRALARVATLLVAVGMLAGGLPSPGAGAAGGVRSVGKLDRRAGLDAIAANGNILVEPRTRRGWQASLREGRMMLYEIDLDTLQLRSTTEIPELYGAVTALGPTEWLWALDERTRRIVAVAATTDPQTRLPAHTLATIDLSTRRAVAGDLLWTASGRLPLSMTFHAPSGNVYLLTRTPVEAAGRSRLYVEERDATGARTWEHELRGCYSALDTQYPPVIARSVLRAAHVYLNCYGSGNVQSQVVRLTLGEGGPVREEVFPAVPGPLSAKFDPGSDRMFFLTTNGGAGRGAWVFDGLRSSFLGVIASGDNRTGASDYAMGLDPVTGRLYMQSPAGFIVADARRTPLPSGLLFREYAGGTTGTIQVDPVKRWVYVPHPSDKNPQGQSMSYLVLADSMRVSKDPPAGDPDSLTTDVAEKAGVTAANYSGSARAFALRALTTGGAQKMAWNLALGPFSPEDRGLDTLHSAIAAVPLSAANRDLYAARVRHAAVDNQDANASAIGAEADDGTLRDLESTGQPWPAKTGECHDEGEEAEQSTETAASATCDLKAASATASSSLSGAASEPGSALSTRTLLAFGNVSRDVRDGIVARATAIVRDVSIGGRVHIGEIRADAVTRARGRKGGARATFERAIHGLRADTDGDGHIDLTCAVCTPERVRDAVATAFGGQIAVEFPEPDPVYYGKGSPGGYQAIVQKDTFRGYAERSLNEDDSPEVPAMQVVLYGDGRAGRSRQIVQLAGVQAESHYGIYLLGSDAAPDPCADGGCEPPAPPAPPAVVTPDAPAPQVEPPAATPPAPTTRTERFLRRFAAGTAIAFAKPGDALLLAALWTLLLFPAYLLWRRRFVGVAKR